MCGAQQAGYAVEPWETVNYADCHDGQTLFDQVTCLPGSLTNQLLCRVACAVVHVHQDAC